MPWAPRHCLALLALATFLVVASAPCWRGSVAQAQDPERLLVTAARVFDGIDMHGEAGVVVAGRKILAVGPAAALRGSADRVMALGDATILPGFIDLHAHIAFRRVPRDKVLRHGITTARDVGGPLLAPSGGDGALRLLTAGPILTVPGGYPGSIFGKGYITTEVRSTEDAVSVVRELVEGGAAVIKIALEPGGEPGAPWTTGHHAGAPPPWPVATLETTSAIVAEAHRLGRKVSAHIGEGSGAALSLAAGVDEWAHVPCAEVDPEILRQAVGQGVAVVTTLDALSHCPGIHINAMRLAALGANFLYGAEIAHPDVPWGIDAQELQLMHHLAGLSVRDVLRAATSKAGAHLGLAPLGTLIPGAPADIIAVRGNALENFKGLEYPDLVVSGGRVVVNGFAP